MERASVDLSYLEDLSFNVERLVDYLVPQMPLCSLHQSRSLLIFLYLISIFLIAVVSDEITENEFSISTFTLFVPLIFIMIFHIFLTIFYSVCTLLGGASYKTCVAIQYYLHFPVGLVSLISTLIYFIDEIKEVKLFIYATFTVAFLIDTVFGLISMRNQKMKLFFEGLVIIPSFILLILNYYNIIPYNWIYLMPFIIFVAFYFIIIWFLFSSNKSLHIIGLYFFADKEIRAEFIAADDFESYWNSTFWRDESKLRRSESDDSSSSLGESDEHAETSILIGTKKRDFRFPRKEPFQLYKLDGNPQYPFYIASIPVVMWLTVLIILAFVQCMIAIPGFVYIFMIAFSVMILLFLYNSRATSWSLFTITNMDNDWVDILWDHPNLSLL